MVIVTGLVKFTAVLAVAARGYEDDVKRKETVDRRRRKGDMSVALAGTSEYAGVATVYVVSLHSSCWLFSAFFEKKTHEIRGLETYILIEL